MTLAFAISQNAGLDSPIDARFGRAAGFLLVDCETQAVDFLPNQQNLNAAQGAGIQAAQQVVNAGAGALFAGHCGPKAFGVLSAGKVAIYVNAAGTVREMLDAYRSGTISAALTADVAGHWEG